MDEPGRGDRAAGAQHGDAAVMRERGGVLAALKTAADAFRLLPKEAETERRWSTAEWSKTRKGWVFLTSKATTRERLRPLLSLWLDLLVLRVMNEGASTGKKTWFVLDELGSLQRLPQLTEAVTERRGLHHPVVLGVPSKAQMEAVYGQETDALLSQAATRIWLKASEPKMAEWISRTIGEVEMERFRGSRGERISSIRRTRGACAGDHARAACDGCGDRRARSVQRVSATWKSHRADALPAHEAGGARGAVRRAPARGSCAAGEAGCPASAGRRPTTAEGSRGRSPAVEEAAEGREGAGAAARSGERTESIL